MQQQQNGSAQRQQPSLLSIEIEDGGLGLGDFVLTRPTGNSNNIVATEATRGTDLDLPRVSFFKFGSLMTKGVSY